MPETITKPPELEELQEHQRAMAQLRQAEEFTMGGHVRSKLRTLRGRLRKTLTDHNQLPAGAATEAEDDMQILARDITINPPPVAANQEPAAVTQTNPIAKQPSRWPLAAALALGMGTPTTTAIVMAPKIIEAWNNKPAVVQPPNEYAPILLPGKPNGVK